MPFYLTNENIEATMERNPDDTFNPSGINQNPSKRSTRIRQLVSQEIKHIFEEHTLKELETGPFCKVDSLKKDSCLSYTLKFETDLDEYEILYHIPFELAIILAHYRQDGIYKIKTEIDEAIVIANKELLLKVSNSIITCLNTQDFTFLQDIELINLSTQKVENEKIKSLDNLHSLAIFIDKKEYAAYLQLDKQFSKIF